jgi:hypothetical protein
LAENGDTHFVEIFSPPAASEGTLCGFDFKNIALSSFFNKL